VLDQAVRAGHQVTAVIRNPAGLSTPVRHVTADLEDPDADALEAACADADAVLSALGPQAGSEEGITWRGTLAIVSAMQAVGARRLVTISAAPVGTVPSPGRPKPPRHDPGDGPILRYVATPVIKAVLRAVYADLARMEDVMADSGLDWTVLRPPQLIDKPLTGVYRTAMGRNVRGGVRISRADLAHLMLAVLDRPETIKQTIGVGY
jgi:putative NADH-flavin reductase